MEALYVMVKCLVSHQVLAKNNIILATLHLV